jgi:hypothetical protein
MNWKQVLLGALGAAAQGASASVGAQAQNQQNSPGAPPQINWQWTGIVAGLYAFGQLAQALAQHPAAQNVPAPAPAVSVKIDPNPIEHGQLIDITKG